MNFADTLHTATTPPLCLHLAPELAQLPDGFSKDSQGVFDFSKVVVDECIDKVTILSISLPQYQLLGPEGYGVFWLTCQYAKEKGLLVLADAKCGEVGAAAGTLADLYLYKESPVDAVSVHPYFGTDSLKPFIAKAVANEKGVFVVVKTNESDSNDVQDIALADETMHEYMAQLIESTGMHHIGKTSNMSCIGAMFASDYPEEVRYARTVMPHLPMLVPYRHDEPELHAAAFIGEGKGALVQVSTMDIVQDTPEWQHTLQEALRAIATSIN